MFGTDVELSRATYQLNKSPLKVNSNVYANFKLQQSNIHANRFENATHDIFANNDHWIPRCQRLTLTFTLSYATQLNLSQFEKRRTARLVVLSVASAEFWLQLGFNTPETPELVDLTNNGDTIQFTLLLYHSQNIINNGIEHAAATSWDISNLRPPYTIQCYHLVCLNISMTFNLDECSYERARNTVQRTVADSEDDPYLLLVNGVLHHVLGAKSSQQRKVKLMTNHLNVSLPNICPSIFVPGYAESLTSRLKLIEPIARILLTYKKYASLTDKVLPDDTEVIAEDREQIEGHLWITMANALRDRKYPGLKALKFPVGDPASISESKLTETSNLEIEDDSDSELEQYVLGDEVPTIDGVLFDLPSSDRASKTHNKKASIQRLHNHRNYGLLNQKPSILEHFVFDEEIGDIDFCGLDNNHQLPYNFQDQFGTLSYLSPTRAYHCQGFETTSGDLNDKLMEPGLLRHGANKVRQREGELFNMDMLGSSSEAVKHYELCLDNDIELNSYQNFQTDSHHFGVNAEMAYSASDDEDMDMLF